MHYSIWLQENEDGSFIAYRQDAPEFAIEGTSYEDALERARHVLADLIEEPFETISVHDQAKQVRLIGQILFDEETGERSVIPYDEVVLVNIADVVDGW